MKLTLFSVRVQPTRKTCVHRTRFCAPFPPVFPPLVFVCLVVCSSWCDGSACTLGHPHQSPHLMKDWALVVRLSSPSWSRQRATTWTCVWCDGFSTRHQVVHHCTWCSSRPEQAGETHLNKHACTPTRLLILGSGMSVNSD